MSLRPLVVPIVHSLQMSISAKEYMLHGSVRSDQRSVPNNKGGEKRGGSVCKDNDKGRKEIR